MSAYNAEKHLAEALDAALAQTYPALEIIVVNDGSTDGTAEILARYQSKGVKVITQANKGQDAALNEGFRHSAGTYIKFMDSDDFINPLMITEQVKTAGGREDIVVYGEWSRFYNDDISTADFAPLDYWQDASPLDFLTAREEGVMLQCGIMLVSRKLIEKAGLWDERLILFNDTEFFNRIFLHAKEIRFSHNARLYYRSGQASSISVGKTRKYFESTFLATNLIADQLLAAEDSARIRRLLSNMLMSQYFQFYPQFSDLGKRHEEKIALYGHLSVKNSGGKIFLLLKSIMGWKLAKRVQRFFYQVGYKRHHS